MDSQRNPFLNLASFCQSKGMDELRHCLMYTTLELETTRLQAQEELRERDDQLFHLKELLNTALRERDEAQEKYQRLLLLLQKASPAPLSGVSSIEDDPKRGVDSSNNGFSSSDCEESIVSSPPVLGFLPQEALELVPEKPLPEKGKLLQAVMKAGPLLQTLLLAGPLPQWRHPPPPLESYKIPLVNDPSANAGNCGGFTENRVLFDGSDSPTETNYQRIGP